MSAWPGWIFTVYLSPRDWPGVFAVVRPFSYVDHLAPDVAAQPFVCVLNEGTDLWVQRAYMDAHGLVCLGRRPADDAVILESWI